MRVSSAPVAAALMLLSPLTVEGADDAPRARYSIRQDQPDTGSHIRRDVVSGSRIPINRPYAELTEEQQRFLKSQYEQMGPNDEPPYPVNGLQGVYKALAAGQQKLLVEGRLAMFVEVNRNGEAVSVSVFASPDQAMTRFAAAVLMSEKYKPALCDGVPCTMQFPFRIDFSTRR